jgi:DNA-binding MarR family transcriptional regulator
MSRELDASEVAGALRVSIGLLVRRLRQVQAEGDLTLPESSALARLGRDGPATPSALAKREQISPQSMGATLATLETHGLVARRPDPADGRSVIISLTEAGRETVQNRRAAKTEHLAEALATTFSRAEREQLMAAALLVERLAESL